MFTPPTVNYTNLPFYSMIEYHSWYYITILVHRFLCIQTLHLGNNTDYKGGVCPFNGKIHVFFGIIVAVWLIMVARIDVNPLLVVVGAIFPDCDHRKAPAGRILPLWVFFKHRGFTHTWYGLAVFSLIVWAVLSREAAFSFAVGYLSHLVLDSGTPSGVHWFGKRK